MDLYSFLMKSESSDGSTFSDSYAPVPCSEFSRKVFVGGLPFDVTERDIQATFSRFGRMHVDWPRRHGEASGVVDRRQSAGYVFLVYRSEANVRQLLAACALEDGRYFINMNSRNVSRKAVQVRPWRLNDYFFISHPDAYVDPRNTVFIGGVPRPTRAVDLVDAMEARFGKVIYASIDIDPELRYPKGAARIVFAKRNDYVDAMSSRFINLPHCGSNKRIDIKPYVIDERMCFSCAGDRCNQRFATYFCAEPACLQYYCERCWNTAHYKTALRSMSHHLPYVRSGDSTRQLTFIPHLMSESQSQSQRQSTPRAVNVRHQRSRCYTSAPSPLLSHIWA
uniref:Cytoplasmic polyadenylation element-binding protein 1 n=1 Tax=Panagrellus redivivus TaxID=6233 RepID=A0A7E4V8C3_PANRE